MLWQDERQLPAKPGGMTKYKLQNVVRDAIVPMDIGLAVNGDSLVVSFNLVNKYCFFYFYLI